jgi:hypothetical protein
MFKMWYCIGNDTIVLECCNKTNNSSNRLCDIYNPQCFIPSNEYIEQITSVNNDSIYFDPTNITNIVIIIVLCDITLHDICLLLRENYRQKI